MTKSMVLWVCAGLLGLLVTANEAVAQRPKLISRLPYTITAPGAYTVRGNLNGVPGSAGITIAASHVTLDLAGFAIVGTNGATHGITAAAAVTNVVVRNGIVRNWPEIGVDGEFVHNGQFERLLVSHNLNGLVVGFGNLVKDCSAYTNSLYGVFAQKANIITDSVAHDNDMGISAGDGNRISRCIVSGNRTRGMLLDRGNLVRDCVLRDNSAEGVRMTGGENSMENSVVTGHRTTGFGISMLGNNNLVAACNVSSNTNGIIVSGDGCVVRDNVFAGNGNIGVGINGLRNRIENNHLVNGNYGIFLSRNNGKNVVIRNSALGHAIDNYLLAIGNDVGPTGTAATVTSPWANISD